eukprot:872718_1
MQRIGWFVPTLLLLTILDFSWAAAVKSSEKSSTQLLAIEHALVSCVDPLCDGEGCVSNIDPVSHRDVCTCPDAMPCIIYHCDEQPGRYAPEAVVESFQAMSSAECCRRCGVTRACVAWSYSAVGVCDLYKTTAGPTNSAVGFVRSVYPSQCHIYIYGFHQYRCIGGCGAVESGCSYDAATYDCVCPVPETTPEPPSIGTPNPCFDSCAPGLTRVCRLPHDGGTRVPKCVPHIDPHYDLPIGPAVPTIICAGFPGLSCPAHHTCIDDPSDSCDPLNGGADCNGICIGGDPPFTDCNCGTDPVDPTPPVDTTPPNTPMPVPPVVGIGTPGEDCPKKCNHGYIDACKKHGEAYKSTCAPPNTNLPKPGVEPFNCECEMVTGIGDPLNPCDECNEPGHVGVCKLWGGVHKFLCLETGKANNIPRAGVDPFDCGCVMTTEPPCRVRSVPKSAFMDTSTPVRNTVKGTSPRVRHLTQICLNLE